jgi:hypothetical protein
MKDIYGCVILPECKALLKPKITLRRGDAKLANIQERLDLYRMQRETSVEVGLFRVKDIKALLKVCVSIEDIDCLTEKERKV